MKLYLISFNTTFLLQDTVFKRVNDEVDFYGVLLALTDEITCKFVHYYL